MFNINIIKLIMLLLVVLFASSCSDPASSEDEHADVDGLELLVNDVVVYKEFNGAYYVNDAISELSAVISLGANSTLDVSVHFLGPDGSEIEHEEEEEEEEELTFTITDENIISIEMLEHCEEMTIQSECEASDHCEWHADENACEGHEEEHCEEMTNQSECEASDHCEWHADENACEGHEDHHKLKFILSGLAIGSTNFKISLDHGSHSDYTSKLISVTVQ